MAKVAMRLGEVRQVLGDPQRKPLIRMIREAGDMARSSGKFPWRYFHSFAYRKDAGPHTEYLYGDQITSLVDRLKASDEHGLLEDKLRFEAWFRSRNFPLARQFAHNEGRTFWVDGAERQVDDLAAFKALVEELRARSSHGSIFVKPVGGMQGDGCRRIDRADADLAELYEDTRARPFLFQETLVQHPALAAIYPGSINTIRLLTCRAPGQPPAVIAAILRLGMGRSIVDNASQGGIAVGIDLETGRLLRLARQFFEYGGKVCAAHPDTGFRFEGFEVPHLQMAVSVAQQAAADLSHPLIGWDLAVTGPGVVLMEGNAVPHLVLTEVALGRGLMTHPPFRQLYQGMGLPS
ncbi:MAG TPA: sugar-transfer associated ATP-grasp domain-containing protein [Geminicoccus sp.]|jgi:hypothetical protein|uniref:sugar-transfer associated ATP-grasp domain-containing protein n=1 Tax=Geminicoccus sp. TaxID=2024832 RepID=UPI002E318073|nr:sugar-transfer associated ATP-grasp domain-containing protein [Geminicoccus sp.]HEX2527575.1 sugar-transfer associated ATP-grasp domain-containing protein [Geminicoccus sp.]